MQYLKIRNWDKWQTYRNDRGQPPWIKLHRELMRNIEWVSLSDAQRGQMVAIWLLAADHNGAIPASPSIIKKLCHMDSDPDLLFFTEQGFIEHDANVTPSGCQSDVTDKNREEAEEEEETETEEEKPLSSKLDDVVEILNYLNARTGKDFKHVETNYKFIRARLGQGHTMADMKAVIDQQFLEWSGTSMSKYLRPATLFNDEKFNQYVGTLGVETPEAKKKRELDEWADEGVIYEQQ